MRVACISGKLDDVAHRSRSAEVANPAPVRRRRRIPRALAVALVLCAGIAAVNVQWAGRTLTGLGLLAVIPFVVGGFASMAGVLVAGGIAAGTAALMADYDHQRLDGPGAIILLVGVAAATAAATASAALKRHRLRQLDRTRAVADVVQNALLRPLPRTIGDVRVAAHYSSATRGALVGGDVYEALATPYGIRVFIGDVRGKGLPAIHLANISLGAFREWAYEAATIADLATHLDASVARNAGPEEFVTAAIVEITESSLEVVNCAHPPPLLIDGGEVTQIIPEQASLPLGLGVTASAQQLPFGAGCRVLLYTDGVSEARRRGKFFDVAQEVSGLPMKDPDEIVRLLHRRLVKFARRKLNDDIAIVLLERSGDEQPPSTFDLMMSTSRASPIN
jgi:serine phosphatase RsbU (regulator of sigma subunit)